VTTGVRLRLHRSLPLAEQLRAQIAHQVLAGVLRPGQRLPPVRVLAGFLRVHRNTVARVYRELVAGGYLQAAPGRGTFVARGRPGALDAVVAARVDELVRLARRAGLGAEDLVALVRARAHARDLPSPRVLFVECNPVDVAYFTRALQDALGLDVRGCLLSDAPRAARQADLVCTTFFHVHEVRRAVAGREVVGLVAMPDFATLERVASLPAGTPVAVVCATAEGARSKTTSLQAVGGRLRFLPAHLQDPAGLRASLARCQVVVASPRVLERLQLPPGKQAIPFGSVLVEGAVRLVRERVEAWRRRRAAAAG
jgi:DNA-binding transcriptional regulator YhcF (GntR family)